MGQKLRVIQNSFTGGQITRKRMFGRSDVARYYSSVEEAHSYLIFTEGGVTKTPGTRFVDEISDSTEQGRLIPFRFNTEQNYQIELCDGLARFYRNRARVTKTTPVTGAANNGSGLVRLTVTAHGIESGNQVTVSGVSGATGANGTFTVTKVNDNTLDLQGSTFGGSYTSGGTMVWDGLVVPYTGTNIFSVDYTQSADQLFLAGGGTNVKPQVISRFSDTRWTIAENVQTDGPYLNVNTSATTLTPSGATGSITLTASAGVFVSTDVGRLVRLKVGSNPWGYCRITAFSSSTSVSATVLSTLTSASGTAIWRLGAWSDTTGYPQKITFHEQRLWYANTPTQPQRMDGSKLADFQNFAPTQLDGTVADDNAVSAVLSDEQVNAIVWMRSVRSLLIGTTDSEYVGTGNTVINAQPITPTNFTVRRYTNNGSSQNIRPFVVNSDLFFVQSSGLKVRNYFYDFGNDSYNSEDITLFSKDITQGKIKELTFVKEPDQIIWACTTPGVLISAIYDRKQQVLGWGSHDMSGGIVESVSTIPNPDNSKDDLWLIVRRTVNGQSKRYVEYMEDIFDFDTNGADSQFFVNSGLTYDGYLDADITLAALTGTGVTITASGNVFTSGMVGNRIRAGNSDAEIKTYVSPTEITVDVNVAFTALTYTSGTWAVAENTFTGLDHLEGEVVDICGDGGVGGTATVSSGGVTSTAFYSKAHIGLPKTSRLKLLPVEAPELGTVQGREKRSDKAVVYFVDTLDAEFVFGDKRETVVFQTTNDLFGIPPTPFTGPKTVYLRNNYDKLNQITIESSLPVACQLLYIVQEISVYE